MAIKNRMKRQNIDNFTLKNNATIVKTQLINKYLH